jgi:Fe-S-cluster containining protein
MKIAALFHSYELLVDKAEAAFHETTARYGRCVTCRRQCSDCCHAIFGLFLIEAIYLQDHFARLSDPQQEDVLRRCRQADEELEDMKRRFQAEGRDPQSAMNALARERMQCPLLDENQDCTLYRYRPITCRVYGIPTAVHGKVRVCGKTRFEKGQSYPVFDLDGAYRDLHVLSMELLKAEGQQDLEKASLLISVSKALRTPCDRLLSDLS